MLGEISQKSTKNLSGCVGDKKKLSEDEETNMYLQSTKDVNRQQGYLRK